MPQPYFVPVRPTCSRMTHKSGVSDSTATSWTLPLMLSVAILYLPGPHAAAIAIAKRHGVRQR
jgi:hypothetical protein